MVNNKFLLFLLFIFILSVSAVSADENITHDVNAHDGYAVQESQDIGKPALACNLLQTQVRVPQHFRSVLDLPVTHIVQECLIILLPADQTDHFGRDPELIRHRVQH